MQLTDEHLIRILNAGYSSITSLPDDQYNALYHMLYMMEGELRAIIEEENDVR